MDRYEKRMYGLAYRMLGNRSDAEDLTQDLFLQVLRKLNTFRGESAFSTWLYRVAINLCKDHLRSRKTVFPLAEDPLVYMDVEARGTQRPEANPETEVEALELAMDIQQALFSLSEEFRLVVVLHDIQGYPYERVAQLLDISVGTVKSRLHRARNGLAERLRKAGTIEDFKSSK